MFKLTVRRVGNALGLALPAEAANSLGMAEGDPLYLTAAPGGYQLVSHDPEFEKAIPTAEEFMRRYRNALRELGR
ncbi:AbrB/MazE/SpoVT family DNA-binding domain-containing protein [bacterium]|nr:MAG: AbrB/MazE/SpoVT family DNA-binding domain-containing protein [bacterium]RKZ14426.1 MAG: AbrB/MazE/SpoVT family DNA-binding domain-containing protein [bacterium]